MSNHNSLGFRSDIEGLRALAILLVVFSHAGFPGFEGGFIGVDLFFVISGYLITGLLLEEIRTRGGINLALFFARRIRRLLPALLFVLTCTAIAAMALLTPVEQLEQITPGMASAAWVSNFYFALTENDYFGVGAGSNLFLHTWSLGVEEQFYLIWPLLLMLACSLAHGLNKGWLVVTSYTLVACLFLSLIFLFVLQGSHPTWAFYLMPARAWQFAIGAICALCMLIKGMPDPEVPCRRVVVAWLERFAGRLGWTGLALILISMLMLDGNVPYPGWRAFGPSLGAALVLLSGFRATPNGVGRLFSLPPMIWLGRLSYSLYLWHWPVLLLGGSILAANPPFSSAILLGTAICLSVLTFHFVENPLRFGRLSKLSPRWTIWGGVGTTFSAFLLGVLWLGGATSWLASPDFERYREVRLDIPTVYAMGCDDWFHSSNVKVCSFGQQDAPHTVVLLGDSIGTQWFPAIAKLYGGAEWRLVVITKSSCPIVDEDVFYSRIGREYIECRVWRDDAIKIIAAMKPDVIFMGSASSYGFSSAQWVAGTRRVLERVVESAGKVYLIAPTPVLPFDGPNCAGQQMWRSRFLPISNECTTPLVVNGRLKEALTLATNGWNNVALLDLNHIICPERNCDAIRGGRLVYRDEKHLASSYVMAISDALEAAISAIDSP